MAITSKWVCANCQRTEPFTPPLKCPVCKAENSYFLQHTHESDTKTGKGREGSARAGVTFLAAAAAGLYAWSETNSGEVAIGAAVIVGLIASLKAVNLLIRWVCMLGLIWLMYAIWTNT